MPNSRSARPTGVSRCRSTTSPAFGVRKKWLAPPLYSAQNTPLAVLPPRAPLGHQARSLQGELHPGVAQVDAVLLPQLLVKVPHGAVKILLPIQLPHLLDSRHGHPPGTRGAPPPVIQPVIAVPFVSPPPAPHLPHADPHNLRCLPPRDPLR